MFHEAAARYRASTRGFAERVLFPKAIIDYRLVGAVRQAFGGIAILVILAGCAATPGQYLDETKSVDITGAYQLTDREAFETIDLGKLLCQYAPQHARATGDANSKLRDCDAPDTFAPSKSEAVRTQMWLDQNLQRYQEAIQKASDQQKRTSRNALQERLLAASAQRCNAYKGNLQRTFSRTNFGLGVLSTIAGTAGALVNSASAASSWSAVGAISSGSRAEFNQDFMSNLAAYVIVDGIDKRRRTIYEQIQSRGQAKGYDAYPVEAAIKDALYYHGQCSVIAGFQEASDSIKYANEPGIDAAINAMAKIKAANSMVRGDGQSPEAILAISSTITKDARPMAGTVLEDGKGMDAALKDFAAQMTHIASTTASLNALRAKLKELNLLESITEPSASRLDDLANPCIGKISGYSVAASADATEAELESDAAKKQALLAKAALSRALGDQIVAAATVLADEYEQEALTKKDVFEQLKNPKVEAQEAFKGGLPKLDATRSEFLRSLCN